MKNQYIVSWILRGLGAVAVLGYFFGAAKIAEWFPGLIGKSLVPLFYVGVVLYIAGAVYYRILFSKERKERERSRKEEEKKAQEAAIVKATSSESAEEEK